MRSSVLRQVGHGLAAFASVSLVLLVGCGTTHDGVGTGNGNTLGTPIVNTPLATGGAPAAAPAPLPSQTPVTTPPSVTMPPAVQPPASAPPAVKPATTPTTTPTPAPTTPNPSAPTPAMMPATGAPMLAMDECGLKTKYKGDEYCIKPPPADKGFQMHIGPSNYDNPEARFVMQPGTEITETVPFTTPNTTEVYFYWRQYRMRPGSHHLIINVGARRLGGSSNMAKDNPEAGIIAPENKGVGMVLPAHSQISNSLHYFNFTDKPIIKEVWVNFWYRDKSEVTQPTNEVFSMLGMGIAPGTHVLKHGSCDITSPGRLLTVYGHVHAHNQRFAVWRTRGADKLLVHDAYDWEHPGISEFSSTVKNDPLNPSAKTDGGYSGVLDLKVGDKLEFECDILNNTQTIFLGANEAEDDEMCIMIGDSIGTTVPFACAATDLPAK